MQYCLHHLADPSEELLSIIHKWIKIDKNGL